MYLDSYNCALWNLAVEESAHHLFVDSPFARMCWDILNVDIPLNCSFPELSSQIKIQLNTHVLDYLDNKEWAHFERK